MTKFFKFMKWLGGIIWKYGKQWGAKIVSAAKNNRGKIIRWLGNGLSYWTILEWILRYIGYN